jgi:AraC-like DNA-binding protein
MNSCDFKSTLIESTLLHPILKEYVHISFDESLYCHNNLAALHSIPKGMSELVINLGTPYYRSIKNDLNHFETIATSHLVGFKTRNSYIIPTKGAKAISVIFKPGCLSLFIKDDLVAFTDKTVEAQILFGKDFKQLEEQLHLAQTQQIQLELIQNFLISKLVLNSKKVDFIRFVKKIYQDKSNFKIKNTINCSADYKKIERNFSQYMGTSPKTFQQIVCFNYASKLISEKCTDNLTQIAYSCNYYDQSHFIKKFKEFSGYTPKEYSVLKNELTSFNQNMINNIF